jgi:hypothetical protein
VTYILSTAKLDATCQRWVSQLSSYSFSLEYRSGKQNIDADALSRIKWPEQISESVVSAVMDAKAVDQPALIEAVCLSQHIVSFDISGDDSEVSSIDWATLQKNDYSQHGRTVL